MTDTDRHVHRQLEVELLRAQEQEEQSDPSGPSYRTTRVKTPKQSDPSGPSYRTTRVKTPKMTLKNKFTDQMK